MVKILNLINIKRSISLSVFLILFISNVFADKYKYDVTIVGQLNFEASLGRAGITFVDMLCPFVKVNYLHSSKFDTISLGSASMRAKEAIFDYDKSHGRVAIIVDTLSIKPKLPYKYLASKIKIAYSMLESTKIPNDWVNLINSTFDAVVVPDEFLVKVYEDCGVQVPIFVIPLSMYLNDFLNINLKSKKNKPFTFGAAATFIPRKNNEKILKAFIAEFGNNKDYQLKLHGRYGDPTNLRRIVNQQKITNVKITQGPINQKQYIEFLKSLDCYVYISRGEGFSLTPREAMAMGIPCILTDNTAQTTICKSGLVKVVNSCIRTPFNLSGKTVGECFDCEMEEVRKAIRDMQGAEYDYFLSRAQDCRNWAKQYDLRNLSQYFVSLVRPKRVILGKRNIVTPGYLETTSQKLYQKYLGK